MRYPLPYAFARGQRLLLEETDPGNFHALDAEGATARSALGQVLRKYLGQDLPSRCRPTSWRSASARPMPRANPMRPRW